jgi:hypothetical protein
VTDQRTPYDVLAVHCPSRRVVKADVLEACAGLENQAVADPPRLAVAAVQDMRFAGPRAREVWRALAAAGTTVYVYGRDLPAYVADGVPGLAIDDDDPLVDVWAFLLVWADGRARAMAASDVGRRTGEPASDDLHRDFDLVMTDDPPLVQECLTELGVGVGD